MKAEVEDYMLHSIYPVYPPAAPEADPENYYKIWSSGWCTERGIQELLDEAEYGIGAALGANQCDPAKEKQCNKS